ncbi:MAG: ABC transporter substrate-binding protein [Acidimicrobiia bacterium]|nr:ABC transporter substrate-binding protein [Acidimicrobiia bacterium]MDH3397753.1 ABC transporter substrate-binding protein [Acidimicrobiia bacterium]
MKSNKRRARTGAWWVVVLVVLALIAAACASDEGTTTTTTAAPGTTQAGDDGGTTTTTAATPSDEKPRMVVALSDTVTTVEPHTFRSTSAYAVTHAVYEPLIVQLPEAQDGGWLLGSRSDHVGAGAESYDIQLTDDGGMLATFTLREDAKFDDGSPVTAEDYKYVFQRSIEGPGYIGVLLPFIGISSADQLTVIDDYTFEIKASVQSPLFERFMTFQVFGALNQALLDANATADDEWAFAFMNDKSAGSGPYFISEYNPDTQVILEPNPNYWDAASVANSGVVIRTVPDATQRAQLVRSGELDVATGIPERLLPELEADPNVNVIEIPTTGVHYMAMNINLIPNVDVRKAIIAAVPYDALIDQVMFGYAAPARGVVTSQMDTYDPAIGAGYATDLDLAAQHLANSGETDVSLVLGVRESRLTDQEAAVLIQENLRQMGIDVEVQVLPDADWAARASAGELPLLIHDWFSWGEDPFYQMQFLTQCGSFVNYSQFCNDTYDELVNTGKFSVDQAVRNDVSSQAQQIMFDNAIWAPLWSTTRTVATGKCVTGLELGYSQVPSFRFLTKTDDC